MLNFLLSSNVDCPETLKIYFLQALGAVVYENGARLEMVNYLIDTIIFKTGNKLKRLTFNAISHFKGHAQPDSLVFQTH